MKIAGRSDFKPHTRSPGKSHPNDQMLAPPKGPPPNNLKPIDSEVEKLHKLKNEQPYLSKLEVYKFRNSFYNNLCLDILQKGYHRAFSHLFHLTGEQERSRQAAGPDSVLWGVTPLAQQEGKLVVLQECLCRAEEAYRAVDHAGMYNAYLQLANYFQQQHPTEDKWLVDHFLLHCLDAASAVEDDDGKKQADANHNLGLAMMTNGNYAEAELYLQRLYLLSKDRDWTFSSSTGDQRSTGSLHLDACEQLALVFTELANQTPSNQMERRLAYYKEAFEMAKESGNKKLEGQCGYRIGMAYDSYDRPDIAINFLRSFYESSRALEDTENLGLACEAMAHAYERQGKMPDCIRFLEEFAEVSERGPQSQKSAHSRACRALGALYNRLGNFPKAAEYLNKSFTISRTLLDTPAANEARVLCGVANGNKVTNNVARYVGVASREALTRLLTWKNSRGDDKIFEKPISDEPKTTLRSLRPRRKPVEPSGPSDQP